jgi:hypothetical protein
MKVFGQKEALTSPSSERQSRMHYVCSLLRTVGEIPLLNLVQLAVVEPRRDEHNTKLGDL